MSKKLYEVIPIKYNWNGIKRMWVLANNEEDAVNVARTHMCNGSDLYCRMSDESWFSEDNKIQVYEIDFSKKGIITTGAHNDPAYMGVYDYVDEFNSTNGN